MNEYKFQLPELKFEMPVAQNTLGVPQLNPGNFNPPNIPYKWKNSWELKKTDLERNYVANKDYKLNTPQSTPVKLQSSLGNLAAAAGIQALSSNIADKMTDGMFGDSYIGLNLANIFSQGVSSAGNTMATNLMKGQALTQGLGQNVGQSIKGAALGLGANLVGQGINSIGGDSRLSRGIGLGVATGIVNAPGIINGIKTLSATGKAIKETQSALSAAKTAGDIAKNLTMLTNLNAFKGAQLTNLAGIGASVLGTALGAATGPSKEYGGKYGNITLTADMIYDLGTAAVGFIPGGQVISGALALNKGLSNLFGSTDGMTVQDAILGSAFMPAPVKWLNMAGATTTGTFNNQSWLNSEKTNSFMGNAFGNLNDKFNQAREEAGKTYGTFSLGAKRDAQRNIDFANYAWDKVLAMADQNELLNIRSQYMSSINNQRYALLIGGAWLPIMRGKLGMKILNNATNHNIGMRLLSAAALIDNKAMILSAQGGTKVTRPPRMRAHRKGDESRGLTPEEQEWWKLHEEEQKRLLEEDAARKQKQREEVADKFNQQVSTVMGAMTLQANETPFTGQEYQQAAENLRQEKVDKLHEAEKVGEAALMADLAVSAAPLLLRGFRWAFNKAGLLVKVPKMAYSAEVKSPYYKIGQDGNLTFDTQNVVSEIKAGKLDFINEMLSPEYAEAAIRNMEEAEKMGLSYTPVFEKAGFKSLREDGIIPKFIQDSKHTWHARTGFMGGTPGKATEIEYNISQPTNIRYSTSHESGHVSRWGMGESKSELEYMKYKANQIFKDNGDVGVYEFGSLTGEGATNMRDLGKDMGITQKTPYPGYEEALKRLKEAEVTSNKGGIVKVLKLTKEAMPYIWRALQGLHFEYAIPTALTATTLYNTNK